ncbi:MAG: hypothetical protein ACRDYD_01645, partial [Acidimicrobiales bacterium]
DGVPLSPKPPPRRLALQFLVDGVKPWHARQWSVLVAPVLVQVAIGAGHWRGGRQRRAGVAWAIAAGTVFTVWGLATEAPEAPEVVVAGRRNRWSNWINVAGGVAEIVVGVPWGLRHPRRLSPLSTVLGTCQAILPAVRAVRGAQKHRLRMAAGGATVASSWLARPWALSMEPLG